MKKAILVLLLILLSAVLLSGCMYDFLPTATGSAAPGGSGQATASPAVSTGPLIEPEQLISKAEAEELIGNKLKDGETTETPAVGMKLCFYEKREQGEGHFFQISITQKGSMPASSSQTPQTIFDALKTGGLNPVAVTGIGGDAFIAQPGLHILYQGYYLSIAVGNSEDAQNQEILKAAGLKAVENLKAILEK